MKIYSTKRFLEVAKEITKTATNEQVDFCNDLDYELGRNHLDCMYIALNNDNVLLWDSEEKRLYNGFKRVSKFLEDVELYDFIFRLRDILEKSNPQYNYSLNEHKKEMTIYLGNYSVATISDVKSNKQARNILEEYIAESEIKR